MKKLYINNTKSLTYDFSKAMSPSSRATNAEDNSIIDIKHPITKAKSTSVLMLRHLVHRHCWVGTRKYSACKNSTQQSRLTCGRHDVTDSAVMASTALAMNLYYYQFHKLVDDHKSGCLIWAPYLLLPGRGQHTLRCQVRVAGWVQSLHGKQT